MKLYCHSYEYGWRKEEIYGLEAVIDYQREGYEAEPVIIVKDGVRRILWSMLEETARFYEWTYK